MQSSKPRLTNNMIKQCNLPETLPIRSTPSGIVPSTINIINKRRSNWNSSRSSNSNCNNSSNNNIERNNSRFSNSKCNSNCNSNLDLIHLRREWIINRIICPVICNSRRPYSRQPASMAKAPINNSIHLSLWFPKAVMQWAILVTRCNHCKIWTIRRWG